MLVITPDVIAYICLVSPLLTRTADQALTGLRPLLDIDEPDSLAMLEQGEATGNLAAEIGARMAYERRLESARNWP